MWAQSISNLRGITVNGDRRQKGIFLLLKVGSEFLHLCLNPIKQIVQKKSIEGVLTRQLKVCNIRETAGLFHSWPTTEIIKTYTQPSLQKHPAHKWGPATCILFDECITFDLKWEITDGAIICRNKVSSMGIGFIYHAKTRQNVVFENITLSWGILVSHDQLSSARCMSNADNVVNCHTRHFWT